MTDLPDFPLSLLANIAPNELPQPRSPIPAHVQIEGVASKALVLGMVFGPSQTYSVGAESRDTARCFSLEGLGFEVKSLDTVHEEFRNTSRKPRKNVVVQYPKHCNASFNDADEMVVSLRRRFGLLISFKVIMLDWFRTPVGCRLFFFCVF